MNKAIALFILTLLPALPAGAAGVPDRLNYQGVLRDAAGDPREGSFDMRFHFFDADTLGNEVLVDEHLDLGTGAVVVTGGLFNVAIGSGNVIDGSGPGVFDALADVFGQLEAVWLEIEVDGETLAPRVAVRSSAYAINAGLLEGKDASEFIDTSGTAQEKTGLLTASGGVDFGPGSSDDLTSTDVSTLTGGGNADGLHTHTLVGNAANSELLDALDSSQFLRSDTDDTYTNGTLTVGAGTVLDVNGQIRLDGALFMDFDGPDAHQSVYFHNGGDPAGEALSWSETLDRFTLSNTLRIENGFHLELSGASIYMNGSGPDTTQSIYFYDGGEPLGQSLVWDDTNGEFWLSSDTRIAGTLAVDDVLEIHGNEISLGMDGPDQIQKIDFYDQGIAGNEFFMWEDASDRFRLSNDVYMNGTLNLQGAEITINSSGPDGNQFVRFYEDGVQGQESLNWDDAQDRFELTDELAISGVIRTGSTAPAPVAYNAIGSGTASSADITNLNDMLVTSDLEIGDQLYMGGSGAHYFEWSTDSVTFHTSSGLHVGNSLANNLMVAGNRMYLNVGGPGNPLVEYLEFFGPTFTLSDDLDVEGTLTANAKFFLQNHPYEPELEIVYTTLEGPEAGTYTRGSARLDNGLARVPLDESFAWVTHPDLGLTASLTPRGSFADLYVVEVTTSELVVASAAGSAPDAAFDYMVMGLHIGYEESPVVRPKTRNASLPDPQALRAQIAGVPELARHTPLARYRDMEAQVFGRPQVDLAAADALRHAVGIAVEAEASLDAGEDTPAMAEPLPTALAASAGTQIDEANDAPGVGGSPAVKSYEDAQGNLYASSFRPNSGGLDSILPLIGDVQPGDVLAVDTAGGGVRRADLAEDAAVVGIATGDAISGADGRAAVPFAVAGIVTCNVDASFGEIRPGDLLVTSPTPGHAMRLDGPLPGTMLGKALDGIADGTGTIRVLVVLR